MECPLLPRVGEAISDDRIFLSDFGPGGGAVTFDSPKLWAKATRGGGVDFQRVRVLGSA